MKPIADWLYYMIIRTVIVRVVRALHNQTITRLIEVLKRAASSSSVATAHNPRWLHIFWKRIWVTDHLSMFINKLKSEWHIIEWGEERLHGPE